VAIFGEVTKLSAIEAWSFEAGTLVILLNWFICYVVVCVIFWLCGGGIGVGIVALILVSIVGCPSVG
jgi:hypothetical protein